MSRILIIDDDESTRNMFCALLQAESFDVVVADCGQSGIRSAMNDIFDLILVDLNLGDMSGIDVVRTLRWSGLTATIVIMTAFPELDSSFDAGMVGADGYVDGPLFDDELCAVVRRALSGAMPIRHPSRADSGIAGNDNQPTSSTRDQRIRVALELIESHPTTGIEAIARCVDLSESRLQHLFKSAVGIPMARFARRRRMQTAARFLVETRDPIAHISERSGVKDFNKAFRSFFGMSPHEYRNRHQHRQPTR